MYLLGRIKDLGYNGKLIVKGDFAPRLNTEVMDKKRKVIGKISRVFGPVQSPYIAVSPQRGYKPSFDIVGKPVYVNKNQRIK